MVINNEITLDISKQTQFVKISLPQGDNVDRVFKINLVNGADIYTIPATAKVRFEMTRKDGSLIYNNCPVENNQAILEITPSISAVDGRFPAQFRITDSSTGGLIKSFRFHILIHESVDIESAVVNTSEFTALQDMELRVGDAVSAIQNAETATANANNAVTLVNDTVETINNETLIIWKPYVATYNNIATTYPVPELGWTTQAQDTGVRWRYNGTEWINIGVVSDDKVGDLSTVTTTNKINVVGAINELDSQLAETANQPLNAKGRKFDEPLITFITDDGRTHDMTVMLPIFQRQGVPFCTSIVPWRILNLPDQYCTIEQLLELQNMGHEIMSHSYSHPPDLTELTDAEIDDEMRLSKEWLNARGLEANSICIPTGSFNNNVKLATQKYYRGSRVSEGYFNSKPIETQEVKSIWISDKAEIDNMSGFAKNSLDHYKYFIDLAAANNYWLVISTHSWEIFSWDASQLLEDIVAYAKTKAKIVTFNDALNKVGNLIESNLYSKKMASQYTPHFVVTNDGDIKSNMTFFKKLPRDTINNNTPISEFDNFIATVCNIMTPNANGFPENTAGNCITYKFNSLENPNAEGFSYQVYKLYNKDKIYYRHVKSDGTWGTWYSPTEPTNQLTYTVPVDTYSGSSKPEDFIRGKKIICRVSASTAGMPFTTAGVLESDFISAFSTSWGFGKQVAKPYGSDDIYVRSAASATAWTSWKKATITAAP